MIKKSEYKKIYKTIECEDLALDNSKLIVEQEEWWRWQYAHRNFYSLLQSNQEVASDFELVLSRLIDLFKDMQLKSSGSVYKNPLKQKLFHQFCNSLVYLYRGINHQDIFFNETCESLIAKHGYSIDELDEDELSLVERLNDWTHWLGFLPTLFYSVPDSSISWDVYINDHSDEEVDIQFLSFLAHPRVGRDDSGIKTMSFDDPSSVNFEWDMVINYNLGDPFYQIEKEVRELWEEPGKQFVGVRTLDSIRTYVDRRVCKKASSALKKLKSSCDESNYTYRKANVDSLTARSVRVNSQGWAVDKDNSRRAVGLYIWDSLNVASLEWDSRRSLIRSVIETLREEAPNKLKLYFSKFDELVEDDSDDLSANSLEVKERIKESRNVKYEPTKYGDTLEVHEIVVREMEADYDLTEYCIQELDYYRAHQVKKAKAKS
ncbi:hypothetical protein [Idiomarina abyssalis]|uniref:hypothetical protein n=1 Tax=Idiomarina abyssalis TaxID=86102 RepID=UPI001CD7D234|nr:hypothetical protein [Idiomarina abyssalis]